MLSFGKMRSMDRVVGTLLCAGFSLINHLQRMRRRRDEESLHVEKILVTKYFGMGSLILASPMIRALREHYPGVRIDLLTIEQNLAISEILPIFDRIYSADTRNLSSVAKTMLRALTRIRREKYDVLIDAEFFSRLSGLVSYFAAARHSVGFYLPEIWRGNFLTHPVHFNYYRHAILAFMALAKSLGAEATDYRLEPLTITDETHRKLEGKLNGLGIFPGQRMICVNVNTGPLSPERRWPEGNFAELIKLLLADFPELMILLIGAPSDMPLVNKLHSLVGAEKQKRVVNVAGKFNLPELCALLRISELLVTNDSGPLHLAEALATPTVSFFGPETPLLYGPTGDNHVVFYKGIYCSPCLNVHNQKKAPCNGNNVCMKLIGPEEVFIAIRMLLRGGMPASPYRVSFDVPLAEVLTDYRSHRHGPSPSDELVAVGASRKTSR